MPIQINSPGWKVRTPGRSRAAAKAGGLPLPGLPPEFLTSDSRVSDEVVLDPAQPTRSRDAARAGLDLSVSVEPGRTAVLAIRHPSGALTFHLPAQSTSRGTRGPSEVRFRLTVRQRRTRGLIGQAVKAIVINVAKLAGDKAAALVVARLGEAVERAVWKRRGLREGWLKVSKETLAARKLQGGKPTSSDRSLLLIHGTFSNAAAAYHDLTAFDFFDRVNAMYGDRIFAFDHFSISRAPVENARMLLEGLPDRPTTFDVITHSRGGLVLRNLVERADEFGNLSQRFKLGRAVLVASPNDGTPLATPERWDGTVGWLANVLELFPDNPFTTGAEFVANGLVWLANRVTGDLPGLHSMDRSGDPIATLQGPPGPPPEAYSALVANYHPTDAVLQRLLDAGIDQFFASANDLVVPSEGGWRVDRSRTVFVPAGRIGCFGPGGNLAGDDVTHVNFFARKASTDFLVNALLGQRQPIVPIDPGLALPDRHLGRGTVSDLPATPAGPARPRAVRDVVTDRPAAPVEPLRITIINGDLTFEPEVLMLGHYRAFRLTGTEKVMDELIGGAMKRSLDMGVYPVTVGTHQIFLNRRPNLAQGKFLPRPKAVIVVGLGEEGKLRQPDLVETVRQAVITWAQRLAESREHAAPTFRLAATLLGSGGTLVTAADSARLVAQGVYEANVLLRDDRDGASNLPYVGELRLIELYLDRASDAWRSLRLQESATPGRYLITETVRPGTGPLPRPADSGYRGVEFDFISIETKPEKDGTPSLTYTLDTRRARSEVRAQRVQSPLIRKLIETASNDQNADEDIRQTLFNLLIPVTLEAYLLGSGEMQMDLDLQSASIPWELLEATRAPEPGDPTAGRTPADRHLPWAIQVKLLRKLRLKEFREHASDATSDASVLIVGEPECPPTYPRLFGARREAVAVRNCLTGVLGRDLITALISDDPVQPGPNARQVINALFDKPWRIVHIAGHGDTGPDGKSAGVVLSEDLFLGPDEIRSMRTVPGLVFVNCCHLGSADAGELLKTYNRAEFASGVAGALIDIGVRCVVAAGWAVDDDVAQTFAEAFYASLLSGDRFIEAVAKARLAAYSRNPHGNTWAAYQCYGDPDWVFRQTPVDANRVAAPAADEFAGVASALSLQFTLERLIVGTRYQGVSPRVLLEKVRVLQQRTEDKTNDWATWASNGAVAELFGHAFVEADDVETGLAWFERAIASEDGTASLRAAEQLANARSRRAWEMVNEAGRLEDSTARRRASTRKRSPSRRRRSHRPVRDEIFKRAERLIEQSLALLKDLIDIEATMERLSLIGSAYKRSALVAAAADRQEHIEQALKDMKSAYRRAQQFGEAHGRADVYYPASNCLVADVAADAGWRKWTLDPKTTALVRTSLASRNEADSDFWSVAGLIELDQYEALASGTLASAHPLLSKAYRDLNQRVQSPKMWVSVYDNACLVLSLYAKRAAKSERVAAETLLTTLREYAHPATT